MWLCHHDFPYATIYLVFVYKACFDGGRTCMIRDSIDNSVLGPLVRKTSGVSVHFNSGMLVTM